MIRRVAFLSIHTSPLAAPGSGDAGGMNVYVHELAQTMAGRGVQVDVFTRGSRGCRGGGGPRLPRGAGARGRGGPRRRRRPGRRGGRLRRGGGALGSAPPRLVRHPAQPLLAVGLGGAALARGAAGAPGHLLPHPGAGEGRHPARRRGSCRPAPAGRRDRGDRSGGLCHRLHAHRGGAVDRALRSQPGTSVHLSAGGGSRGLPAGLAGRGAGRAGPAGRGAAGALRGAAAALERARRGAGRLCRAWPPPGPPPGC